MPDKEIMLKIKARIDERAWNALDAFFGALPDETDAHTVYAASLAVLVEDFRATADLYEAAKGKGFKTLYVDPLRAAAAEVDKVAKALLLPRPVGAGQLRPKPQQEGAAATALVRDESGSVIDRADEQPPAAAAGTGDTLGPRQHHFEVAQGASGAACTAMVERDGAGDSCGRPSGGPAHLLHKECPAVGLKHGHPAHDWTGGPGFDDFAGRRWCSGHVAPSAGELAARPASLDALIADAQAAARSAVGDFLSPGPSPEAPCCEHMLSDDGAEDPAPWCDCLSSDGPAAPGQHPGPCRRLAHLRRHHAAMMGPHQTQVPIDTVSAYLSGAADSIPGLPDNPGPSSVRDQTDERTAVDNAVAQLLTDPRPVEDIPIRTAKEILETASVTTNPAHIPVPLLGQPGDMGPGYDHAWIPPGGVPATFAELLTMVPVAALPSHISHSQMESVGECGVKYRLQRIGRPSAVPGISSPIEQIPQWALIGGSAFHAAVEELERREISEPGTVSAGRLGDPAALWRHHFETEIAKVEATSPVPRSRWRGSKQGKEGETWWEVNGPRMIEYYLAARPTDMTAQMPLPDPAAPGTLKALPAIELEISVPVPTAYGLILYQAILDRVTACIEGPHAGALIIRDYKTGDRMPDSLTQLGEYTQALRLLGVPPQVKILGTYFNARKGVWTQPVDLEREGFTAEWFLYAVTTGHSQRLALTSGPTPARPSSFCGGCSVRWACPVKTPRTAPAPGGAA